jgi:hypothetical protein
LISLTARFDVQRSDKSVYSIATVVKVDFSGSVKRIMFHYSKTSSDRDEWVEFGSSRIAPLYTKVKKKEENIDAKVIPLRVDFTGRQTKVLKKKRPKSTDFGFQRSTDGKLHEGPSPTKKQKLSDVNQMKERKLKVKKLADPTDEKSFVIGGKRLFLHFLYTLHYFCFRTNPAILLLLSAAQFDVYRKDKKKFCWAVVTDVDFVSPVKRVCFRFTKTKDNHIEWIEFGSPYICLYKSKVIKKELKPTKADSRIVAPTIPAQVPSDLEKEESFFIGGKFFVYIWNSFFFVESP